MTPRLEKDDIHQLADRIWESMFGDGLERLEEEARSADERFLTGCVQLTGAWEGAAVVRCSFKLACHLASVMFGSEELAEAEVSDCVGEMTNLTAGAVQAMVPSPSELTPPSVVEGKDYKLVLPRCQVMNQVHFRFHNEPFNILVFTAAAVEESAELARSQLS